MDTSHPLGPAPVRDTDPVDPLPSDNFFDGKKTYITAAALAALSVVAVKWHIPVGVQDWLRANMNEIIGIGIAGIGAFLRHAHKKATGV